MATRYVRKTWKVENVLTDVTTCTYGITSNVPSAVIVAAGTAMPRLSTGTYEASFTDTVGVAYTATIVIVYAGATFTFEEDFTARTTPGDMTASYSSLLERVGHFLFGIRSGYTSDQVDDVEMCIHDGLREIYAFHNWSFFRPVKTITTVSGTSTYSLPTAYESIETELHYAPGESDFYPPVRMRHDSEIRKLQQDNEDTEYDRPRYFSVRTVEFDPAVGSLRQLVLWPTPDDAYVLYARMTLRPVAIDAVNQYPVGAEQLSQVILESCLAAAERNLDDAEGVHRKRFQELLPLAIQADQNASSPLSLGSDAPQGENTDLQALSVRTGAISLDGVTL
jgi:hypothetical protein